MFLLFLFGFLLLSIILGITLYERTTNNEHLNAFTVFLCDNLILFVTNYMLFTQTSKNSQGILYIFYIVSMLMLAPAFLSYIYALLDMKKDRIYYALFTLNFFSIFYRFFLDSKPYNPLIYGSDAVFKVIYISMVLFASLSMLYAIFLLIRAYRAARTSSFKSTYKYTLFAVIVPALTATFFEGILPFLKGTPSNGLWIYLSLPLMAIIIYFSIQKNFLLLTMKKSLYDVLYVNSPFPILLFDEYRFLIISNSAFSTCFPDFPLVKHMPLDAILSYFTKSDIPQEIIYNDGQENKYYRLTEIYDKKTKQILLRMSDITNIRAVERERLETAKRQNYLDALTSIYNRRYFDEKVMTLDNTEIGLIIIDIDDFKSINDNFGHSKGDELLINLARILTDSIRSDSAAIRYGGDEFIVFVPNRRIAVIKSIAERILKNNADDEYMQQNNIAISIGVSSGNTNIQNIFEAADQALYKAKDQGKNQICIVQY